MISNLDKPAKKILKLLSKMIECNKKQYIVDVKVMNYLLQAIPNDIYNSVDACKNAKDMWEQIKRLIFGSDVTSHVRHSRIMDEFDKFATKECESLEFVYERLTTLSKYVTVVRQNQTGDTVSYDELYDSLVQFKPHVLASREKKASKNHDPLALLANINASSSQSHANSSYLPQPYYVIHPLFVADYEDENQGENARRHNRNQAFNAGTGNDERHYDRDCQKPRVRDAKYFREQMLRVIKDEAESNLKDEENDFTLDNSYEDETLEELTVVVIMMARIQQADENAESEPSYDAKGVSEVENNGGTSEHDSNAHDEYHDIEMLANNIVDSGCLKNMTGNLSLLRNFVEKFMGIVCFRNDHFASITRYGDYVQGNLTICHAKAIATACFTQKRFITHTQYNKTPYELIHGGKPNVQYFYVFGYLCYPTNNRDDHGKIKPKADIEDKAPQIVSSSAEQVVSEPNTLVLNDNADELVQEDVAELDGNFSTFNLKLLYSKKLNHL
nr:integrase, catalytic region, zinc finger, CCHC-type, peptidase aspartic, catalytic [Tanacetum cinerariifolium]